MSLGTELIPVRPIDLTFKPLVGPCVARIYLIDKAQALYGFVDDMLGRVRRKRNRR